MKTETDILVSIGNQGTRHYLRSMGLPTQNAEGAERSNVRISELEALHSQLLGIYLNTRLSAIHKRRKYSEWLAFLTRIINQAKGRNNA